MSTASKPTYFPAVGKQQSSFRSAAASAKDQVGHTQLKFRQYGQNTADEVVEKDFRSELLAKEAKILQEKHKKSNEWLNNTTSTKDSNPALLLIKNDDVNLESLKKYDDSDIKLNKKYDDEDENDSDDFDSSSDESDDEDDDEKELQAELERIREERAQALAKKEQEEKSLQEKLNREESLRSNPLVDVQGTSNGSAKIKRRWNDDVVFRNQARDEPEAKKRFINDTIRSDFHRSFLKKYIK